MNAKELVAKVTDVLKDRPLVALVAAIMPWAEYLARFDLISRYFFPSIYIAASAASVIAVLFISGMLRGVSALRPKKIVAAILVSTTFVLFTALLALTHTVGITWFPDPDVVVIIRIVWCITYVAFFSSSFAMLTALLSLQK